MCLSQSLYVAMRFEVPSSRRGLLSGTAAILTSGTLDEMLARAYGRELVLERDIMSENTIEVRWHGRGGQGAKTAAQLVARAALEEGKCSQGFPEYGPERMGAPIRGFTRVSTAPIRLHCPIERPNVVVVLDETLMRMPTVTEGVDQNTVFVVNTTLEPGETGGKLDLAGSTVFCVDATRISIEELGRPMPNMPMVGALIKATGCISMDVLTRNVERKFGASLGERVAQGNIRAIQRAYEEVRSS